MVTHCRLDQVRVDCFGTIYSREHVLARSQNWSATRASLSFSTARPTPPPPVPLHVRPRLHDLTRPARRAVARRS